MKIKTITEIVVTSVLITLCAWISIPFTIAFTLQILGIAITLKYLGGKKGLLSIILYLALGAIGIPVFSGFKAGLTALMGPTGGFILGFLLWGLVYMLLEPLIKKPYQSYLVQTLGLLLCYIMGVVWFMILSTNTSITFSKALLICVVPFIIPDLLKIFMGEAIGTKLKVIIPIPNKTKC